MISTVIVVPVLNRHQNVQPLMEAVAEMTPEPHRLLFVASPHCDDELVTLEHLHADYIVVPYQEIGDYARKVNAAYEQTTEPFLFLGADDIRPHYGWLSAAMKYMGNPDIGVVGTQDQGNARVLAGVHSTHSLVRRAYIDAYGTIDTPRRVLHEDYWHEYVDDELVATAKHRGAWVFAHDSTVEHLHPHYGKADTDDIYERQMERMRHSRQLFRQRSRLWA